MSLPIEAPSARITRRLNPSRSTLTVSSASEASAGVANATRPLSPVRESAMIAPPRPCNVTRALDLDAQIAQIDHRLGKHALDSRPLRLARRVGLEFDALRRHPVVGGDD